MTLRNVRRDGKTAHVVNPEELDQRIAEELARQQVERDANPMADTSMFLSHHWPSRYDRCAVIGGRHICRRCAVLYPVAILVALAAGAGLTWPSSWDVWLLWLLPVPGVVEFVLDTLGAIRYSPVRQVIVSALLAVAYGRILWIYAHDPTNALIWAVVITDTGVCLAAVLLAAVLRKTWIDTGTGHDT
jgi:hypothetical protein